MDDHKHLFPISKMSQTLDVSRSGYYRWRDHGPSGRAKQNNQFKRHIRRIWEASNKVYGSPRIHRQLLAEGQQVSRPRVARLMAQTGIASQTRPTWTPTTDSGHALPVAPNRLGRSFTPGRLGQVWVSDITYLPSKAGWLYVTTVMDLADRQVIGWSGSKGLKASQTSLPPTPARSEADGSL